MEKKIRDIVIREYLFTDDLCHFDEAIERIEKRDDKELERQITCHEKILDKEVLFGSIDNMIMFLTQLKREGYESVSEEWYGYENNYFVAKKHELETDDEYLSRVWGVIDREIEKIENELEEQEQREKEIARLETEIEKLRNKN